jgi:hypothetical protein
MKQLVSYGSITFALAMLFAMTASAAGPAPVDLGLSGNFAILSKAGITDVPLSDITGNIGTSPISGTAIGVTCAEVTGTIFSVDAAGPLPCRITDAALLTTAVKDMQTAYTNAAGRPHGVGATNLNVGRGTLNGQTFSPGTYTWTSNVVITGNITLAGGANDVWIFQIAGTLNIASGTEVILSGALAENVFWQVSGATTLGTNSTFNGTILDKTNIAMQTGAVLNGRALAQTAVTLDHNTVTVSGAGDATPKAPNFDSQLNDKACGEHLVKVIDVTEKVINDVDSGLAGNWAFDNYTRHIKVWSTGSDTYCAAVVIDGTAFAIGGATGPGGSVLIGDNVKAKMKGGYRATIIGTLLPTPLWPTHGSVGDGTVDYLCNSNPSCLGYIDWVAQYFGPDYIFAYDWWGYFYDAGKHGTWLNSASLTTGNIE